MLTNRYYWTLHEAFSLKLQLHYVITYLFLFSPVFICFPLQFIFLGLSCHKPVLSLLLLHQSLLGWRRLGWFLLSINYCTIANCNVL